MFACTFIGHKNCSAEIKNQLYSVIEDLINKNNVDKFYVGTHGNFDFYVYSVLSQLKNKYEIKIVVALAYIDMKPSYYNEDETVFPEILESCPRKFAILKRNKYMIEKSNFLVAYVNNAFSNAYKSLEYAEKRKLKIINLGKYKTPD